MDRKILFSALGISISGSIVLFLMSQFYLATGWWLGIIIGLVNFSTLLAGVRRSQAQPNGAKKLKTLFFLRYVLLGFAFFLIIQLGKDQLGSSVLGFVSLYAAFFADYVIRSRKQRKNV